MVQPTRVLLLFSGFVVAGVGCVGSGDDDDHGPHGICADESRDDEYVAGLEKTGAEGLIRTTLDSALPAPPDVGDNAWTIHASSIPGGAPLSGCAIDVTPFMPDHNHGTATPVVVTTAGTAGEYHLDPIDFIMPGYWEVTLRLSCPPGPVEDQVVYKFCAEG